MAIYQIQNGQQVKLKATQVRSLIMKVNKLSDKEYNKLYDITRNKLRAFENYVRSSGRSVQKQSVSEFLYYEAKAKQRYGKSYKPSLKAERIKSFPSISSGKKGQQALKTKGKNSYRIKRDIAYLKSTKKQFKGFIDSNEGARKIWENYKDKVNPVDLEKMLTDYAEKVGARAKGSKVKYGSGAIPTGQSFGSTDIDDEFFSAENLLQYF